MKKLAIASAIIALSSSAFAAGTADNAFYIKAGGSGSWSTPLDSTKQATLGISNDEWGNMTFGGTVGVGYHVMDNVRAEIALSYVNGPRFDDLTSKGGTKNKLSTADSNGKVKLENSGFVGSVNGFVDVADMGAAKLYVGGGIGGSYLDSKITASSFPVNGAVEFKKEFAFSFNVGGGMSFEASPGMLLDVGYSYMDLGKPGNVKTAALEYTTKDAWPLESHASHNLNVGLD
jgi:opacity protein-like surface antigen